VTTEPVSNCRRRSECIPCHDEISLRKGLVLLDRPSASNREGYTGSRGSAAVSSHGEPNAGAKFCFVAGNLLVRRLQLGGRFCLHVPRCLGSLRFALDGVAGRLSFGASLMIDMPCSVSLLMISSTRSSCACSVLPSSLTSSYFLPELGFSKARPIA
jgi:hypothetical protein